MAAAGRVASWVFLVVVMVALLSPPQPVTADLLDCYTCVSTNNELTCVEDPDNIPNGSPITSCEMEGEMCCTIFRQEYKEDPGTVISFSRGCQNHCPPDGFVKTEDSSFIIYQTTCSTPVCNVGPGNEGLTGGGGGGGGGGDNIVGIPGVDGGDSATHITFSLTLVLTSLATVVTWTRWV